MQQTLKVNSMRAVATLASYDACSSSVLVEAAAPREFRYTGTAFHTDLNLRFDWAPSSSMPGHMVPVFSFEVVAINDPQGTLGSKSS